MCPTCNNLKIKEISIDLNNGERVKLNSNDYDIGFYMNKFKMGGDDLSKSPWTLNYEIVLNGKFDRDKVRYDFSSKEMFDELNSQKNSIEYKDSCNKLKDIFWNDHKMLNVKYENMVEFKLSNGNIHKILSLVDFDNYPNIPKITFSRDGNNPIK